MYVLHISFAVPLVQLSSSLTEVAVIIPGQWGKDRDSNVLFPCSRIPETESFTSMAAMTQSFSSIYLQIVIDITWNHR